MGENQGSYNQELSDAIRQFEESQKKVYESEETPTVQRNIEINKGSISGGLVFFIIGLLFFVIGIFVQKQSSEFYATALSTQGTIQSIEKSYDATSENTEYTVIVRYSVDGKVYENEINSYSNNWKKGTELTVYYDPENPDNVDVKLMVGNLNFVAVMTNGIGGIAMIIGFLNSGILFLPISEEKLLSVSPEKANMMISVNSAKGEALSSIGPIFAGLFFVFTGIAIWLAVKSVYCIFFVGMGTLVTFAIAKNIVTKFKEYNDLKNALRQMY